MKYTIYLITNLLNKKQYIGKTKKTILQRFIGHKSKYSCCIALRNAIQKYGAENFKIEEIESCETWEDSVKIEYKNIVKYNTLIPNGYNIILETTQGREWSEEMKKKSSKNMQGRAPIPNTRSDFIGVRPDKKKWSCRIMVYNLGKSISKSYSSEIEAATMYDRLAIYLFGPTAIINFPNNLENYIKEDLQKFYNLHLSRKLTTSNFNGVYKRKDSNKWSAEVRFEGKQVSLGAFDSEVEAARMYDICHIYLNKNFYKINFPENIIEYNTLDVQKIFNSRIVIGKNSIYPGIKKINNKYLVYYRDNEKKYRCKTFYDENEAIFFKKSIPLKEERRSWKLVKN